MPHSRTNCLSVGNCVQTRLFRLDHLFKKLFCSGLGFLHVFISTSNTGIVLAFHPSDAGTTLEPTLHRP